MILDRPTLRVTPGRQALVRTTQVVMQRWFCTADGFNRRRIGIDSKTLSPQRRREIRLRPEPHPTSSTHIPAMRIRLCVEPQALECRRRFVEIDVR